MKNTITEQIDRLLHDAQHAQSGAIFAAQLGHAGPAGELQEKYRALRKQAEQLFLDNPDSEWPDEEDCDWPKPQRQ